MQEWSAYFFGSFFRGRLAKEGASRSIVNGIAGCVLAGLIIFAGLYAGHIASFSHLWDGAQSYRDALYTAVSSGELSFHIKDGAASSSGEAINTYISDPTQRPIIISDFRDIEHTYVAFSVGYVAKDGRTLSEAGYAALSEGEKQDFALYADCTDEIIDPAEPSNIAKYQAYLTSLPDTSAYTKLDPNAADYADQLYRLYVSTQYPQITVPPVLLNYYNQLLDEFGEEAYFILLPNHCFFSFMSGDIPVSVSGHYTEDVSSQDMIASTQEFDLFFAELFSSSNAVTVFIYLYNLPRSAPTVILLWLLLSACSYVVCRSKSLEFGSTMLSSMKVCGSFLFFSGVIAALAGFIGSFFAAQSEIYSLSLSVFYLVFAVRCVIFLVSQLIFPEKEAASDEA